METLDLRVAGMSCGGCEQRIATVLRRIDGVREVTADHTTARVQIRVGPELADRSVLGERLDAAGFEVLDNHAAVGGADEGNRP